MKEAVLVVEIAHDPLWALEALDQCGTVDLVQSLGEVRQGGSETAYVRVTRTLLDPHLKCRDGCHTKRR